MSEDIARRRAAADVFVCDCGETIPRKASTTWTARHIEVFHADKKGAFGQLLQLRDLLRTGRVTIDEVLEAVPKEARAEARDLFEDWV